jgi:hypothetical protein
MIPEFRTLENAVLVPSRYTAPMFRRWLIRGLVLALLALCVVALVGSYRHPCAIGRHGIHELWLHIRYGSIVFNEYVEPLAGSIRWECVDVYADHQSERMDYLSREYHFAGFAYEGRNAVTGPFLLICIPLWFPTLLCTLLLWFVWRKTRAKPAGGAFPVEPAKAEVK